MHSEPGKTLVIVRKRVDELSKDPANARKHNQRNIDVIIGSLRRFGQQKPIVIDSSNVVRAGNGTLEAASQLGWTEIDCVVSDLKGSEATAFAIVDNRATDMSEFDQEILAGTLDGLAQEDMALLEATGFDQEELEELMQELEDNADSPDEFPSMDEDIETDHECPKCGYRWSGSTSQSNDD